MSYRLKVPEASVFGKRKYLSKNGNTECVAFVQQVTGAPVTTSWKPGKRVADAAPGEIFRGTAIATFVDGHYPTDNLGMHAAIYLSHNADHISVLDQWKSQGEVRPRRIYFHPHGPASRSNDASTFYVIE
jgi:hypothetical protein